MERKKLDASEIASRLEGLEGWASSGDRLVKRYKFNNFAESLDFVNKVGEIAEEHDHHPDITFGWGYAEIAFTTHDRGGVTDVDFALAEAVSSL